MPCMNFSDDRESSERTTALLDEVDLDAEFVDRHPVLDVAVETIRSSQPGGFGRSSFFAQERDHLAERRAAGALGGLDVLELLNDVNALALGVIVEQLSLRRDRESLSLAPWTKHGRIATAERPVGGFAAGCWRARLFMAVQDSERCQCRQKGVPKTILAGSRGSGQLARGTSARLRRAVLQLGVLVETRIACRPLERRPSSSTRGRAIRGMVLSTPRARRSLDGRGRRLLAAAARARHASGDSALTVDRVLARGERDVAATAAAALPDGEPDQLQAVEHAVGEVQLGIREFAGRVGFVVRNDLDDHDVNLLKSSPPRRAVDADE